MPRLCSFSRLSLVALFLALLGSVAWAKPKVAILGLETINVGGVDPKDAANASTLTEALRAIPRGGIGKFDFAANSNRELQDEKLMGNCDNEKATCMAPIGAGLGAEYLIYGNMKKDKDGYKVSLKLLLVKPPKVEETEEFFVPLSTLTGGTEPVKEWAQKAYAKLTGEKQQTTPPRVDPGPGKLIVNANAKSGDVFIGGEKKGRLVDGTIMLTLPEGSHELAIEAEGYKRYEATVSVKSGPAKMVDATLEEVLGPVPPPIGGKKGFPALKAAGYGLAAVGLASGAYVLYLTVAGPEADYAALEDGQPFNAAGMQVAATSKDCGTSEGQALRDLGNSNSDMMFDNNRAFDRACKANRRRWITLGVFWPTAVAGAALLYFAYRGDDKPSAAQSAAGGRRPRDLTVTPVIGPGGAGATLRFTW